MASATTLTAQSSNVVITPNAGGQGPVAQRSNIFLTYENGTKAVQLADTGNLILGADTPDYSGSTYGGSAGTAGQVLSSQGPGFPPVWSNVFGFIPLVAGASQYDYALANSQQGQVLLLSSSGGSFNFPDPLTDGFYCFVKHTNVQLQPPISLMYQGFPVAGSTAGQLYTATAVNNAAWCILLVTGGQMYLY